MRSGASGSSNSWDILDALDRSGGVDVLTVFSEDRGPLAGQTARRGRSPAGRTASSISADRLGALSHPGFDGVALGPAAAHRDSLSLMPRANRQPALSPSRGPQPDPSGPSYSQFGHLCPRRWFGRSRGGWGALGEPAARVADQLIEVRAAASLGTRLGLRVHVHRHLRVHIGRPSRMPSKEALVCTWASLGRCVCACAVCQCAAALRRTPSGPM